MKYLIIIIIFFAIIFYYNLILSKTNNKLREKEQKYKYLKSKMKNINNKKTKKEPKKVEFVLDNLEQDNIVDSIFTIDNEKEYNDVNNDLNSFGLESFE
jgi:hypothetical protein